MFGAVTWYPVQEPWRTCFYLGQRALTPPPIFSGLPLPRLFVFLLLLSFCFSFFLFKNYKIHQNFRKVQKIVLLIFHHFPPRISRMRDWEPYNQQQTHQAHLAFRSTALSLACFASSPHPKLTSLQSLAPDIPLPGGHTEFGPLNDYVHSHSMGYFYTNCYLLSRTSLDWGLDHDLKDIHWSTQAGRTRQAPGLPIPKVVGRAGTEAIISITLLSTNIHRQRSSKL